MLVWTLDEPGERPTVSNCIYRRVILDRARSDFSHRDCRMRDVVHEFTRNAIQCEPGLHGASGCRRVVGQQGGLQSLPACEIDDESSKTVYYPIATWGLLGQRVTRDELLVKLTTTSGTAGPSMHAVVRVCRPSTVL